MIYLVLLRLLHISIDTYAHSYLSHLFILANISNNKVKL